VVGRATGDWRTAPDLDLDPLDGGRVVSRRHAHLECGARGVFLRDLDSTNGTAVAGRRLERDELVRLQDGDLVSFGGVQGRFLAAATWPEGLQPAWTPAVREDLTRPGPR
jgi:pSer/pThr/pTyr-binding forkhead associated (FHA) protein